MTKEYRLHSDDGYTKEYRCRKELPLTPLECGAKKTNKEVESNMTDEKDEND